MPHWLSRPKGCAPRIVCALVILPASVGAGTVVDDVGDAPRVCLAIERRRSSGAGARRRPQAAGLRVGCARRRARRSERPHYGRQAGSTAAGGGSPRGHRRALRRSARPVQGRRHRPGHRPAGGARSWRLARLALHRSSTSRSIGPEATSSRRKSPYSSRGARSLIRDTASRSTPAAGTLAASMAACSSGDGPRSAWASGSEPLMHVHVQARRSCQSSTYALAPSWLEAWSTHWTTTCFRRQASSRR
jgi:hypothetical protein